MLRYRTLYLPLFLFYIEWKSVRLELLTSIVCVPYGTPNKQKLKYLESSLLKIESSLLK